MKKKILAIILITLLIFTNYSFVLGYTREGGQNLNNIARIIDDDIYLDGEYNMYGVNVPVSNIKIYEYNSTVEKTIYTSEEELPENNNNNNNALFYQEHDNSGDYFAAIRLDSGEQTRTNLATVIYKNAIIKNGLYYDVKINFKEIHKTGEGIIYMRICPQYRMNDSVSPMVFSQVKSGHYNAEVNIEYSVIDGSGNAVPISGLFGITDLDYAQGVAIEDFTATEQNTFMYDTIDTIKYKVDNGNTYIYSSIDYNTDNTDNAYVLLTNKNVANMVFTWEDCSAASTIVLLKDVIKRYYNIDTQVIGGTITPQITEIKNGESRTVTYAPNDSTRQYLKSITVDGNPISTTTYPNSYTFSNITDGHTIRVEYADKYKVEFDAKGGNPTPDTQYVLPAGKATEPTTNPTKIGYTFGGWKKANDTNTYNFDTPVNSDIELEAVWTTDNYGINYVLNGGTNDSRNPNTYKVTDTIDFQPATKEGYVFKGWYEDEGFVSPIGGISNRVGDVTVYAKWEARGDVTYKVEHYKKNENGNYEKVTTDELTGTMGETVTAVAKDYAGFRENTTHGERVQSGTVKADGSLVLKLYYDPIIYHINYVLNGGTNDSRNPSTYKVTDTVNFQPATKTGYNFISWNRNENLTDPIAGFTGGTEDITVYAKWEAKNGVAYKVEHYQKNENGNYEKITTDELTGTVGEKVTAVAKNYVGFKENTSHAERVATGTVKADGSLVLKLYYDPDIYNINYVLNGGTNDSRNPKTYKVTDTVNFQPATRPGYDFVSWYEDENLTKPIAGFTGGTEDITVYAKWEAQKNIEYKVEHYKETKNGEYELVVTDTLVGEIEEEVRAEAKEYPGFKENTTYSGRIPTGKIKLDGSLVLKLYYDKIKYTVTFDPQNDSKIPEQIVPYQEKATDPNKPTKEDYEFEYWYYMNEEEQEVKYNFDDPVTSDIHLIAKWTKVEKVVENTKAPTPQKDTTSAPTPIPQTGDFNPVMVFSIIAIVTLVGTFGIKYFSIKIK